MSIQRELSNQEELVHQLDPEPVFDYLLQHRALDQSDVELIRGEEKLADRNVKLLQHLEELGNPAVELFINALRQSGQLHLASLLDGEHRIKPVYGQGYWEKQRYKGQIALSFQLVAAKVMVKKDSEEDRSPKIVDINAMLTPFKVKHSYENMTLIDEDENGPRARKILEYSYDEEDDDKRSCCWCCIPFFCCSSKPKSKSKPDIDKSANVIYSPPTNGAQRNRQNSASSLELYDIMVALPSQPSSPIKSGSTFFKTKKLSPSVESPSDIDSPTFVPKSDNVDRNSNHQLNDVLNNKLPFTETGSDVTGDVNEGDVSFKSTKSDRVDKSKKKNSNKTKNKSDSMLEIKNQKNGHLVGGDNVQKSEDKENSDPLILALNENGNSEVKDKKMKNGKKSPPKSLKTQTSTGMTRSETYELVERWKSEGRAYQTARDQFFSFFDNSVQGRIVRYFEQERSTLVLQISVDDKMAVCTICMTTREVRKLREDYEKGTLHEELVKVVDPQDVVDKMECCAIHLRTVINDEDFTQSYQELS